MKKFWVTSCLALGAVFYAGTAQAAFWQIVRDTPVRADASADAKVLGTLKKGWIVSDLLGDKSTAQWINVVEFEKNPGEGMAYAYMIFNSPDSFVSAEDVAQVNEDRTPLQPKNTAVQGEQGQGLIINPLPAPKTDSAALNAALEAWIQECNAIFGTYQAMEPEKAAAAIMDWENAPPFPDKSIKAVENSAETLLNNWINALYGYPQVPLSAEDQKKLDLLAEYGLTPQFGEGSGYLEADLSALSKRISFNPPIEEYDAYMNLVNSQPQKLFSDGGCIHSVTDMGTWAMQWEQYLSSVDANSIYFNKGKYRFIEFADFILFSSLPNTPAFPEYNGDKMTKEWIQELKNLAKAHPETQTAALIKEFVTTVKANGNKLPDKAREALIAKMAAIPEALGIGR